ncbi:MAG: DeoR/GlpR family DNA-binding transcription regulator [Synergistaceae bacterium]|jgi:DeoR/GlpR family transcriptional regulator of sugar metabolism|nr:DeoR/GlpR family DNA-binding transcription regulator [Synergistaceae bacterium]
MKNSYAEVDMRRKKIIRILEENGLVKINKLSDELKLSPLTIRRDLNVMERENLVKRFRGGAALIKMAADDNIFSSTLTLHKHAIARRAALFVDDGDTIFINTSSTALILLQYITAKQVTVITNNARATNSKHRDDMIVVLTGGELRLPKEAMVGEFAINNLNRVVAVKSFLGCNGISIDGGLTTAVLQEAAVNELMLTRVTGRKFILADKTKVGCTLSFIYGSINQVSCLITDTEASPGEVGKLRGLIDVIQVEPLVSGVTD